MKRWYGILAVALIMTTGVLNAQWERTYGTGAPWIASLGQYGNHVAATSEYSVFTSANSGRLWTVRDSAVPPLNYITTNGSYLFASEARTGILRSGDDGRTWQLATTGIPYPDESMIASLTCINGVLYAGVAEPDYYGMYRSTDNGGIWYITDVVHTTYCYAADGSTLYAGTNGDGIWVSPDSGSTWAMHKTGLPYAASIRGLAVIPSPSSGASYIFAGTWGDGVYRSHDNGQTWVQMGLSGYFPATVYELTVIGTTLFAGTAANVYRSTDLGGTWVQACYGMPTSTIHNYFRIIAVDSMLFAGTTDGFFQSTDSGDHWTPVQSGIPGGNITSFAADGGTLWAGGKGGVYLTTNNGSVWSTIDTGLTNLNVWSLARFPNGAGGSTMFAGTDSGAFRSLNDGTNWTQASSDSSRQPIYAFAASGSNVLAGSYYNGPFLSTNNGTDWHSANNGISTFEITSLAAYDTNILAGTYGRGIYHSSDQGQTWSARDTGLATLYINTLATRDSIFFAGSIGGVHRSTDNGLTWTAAVGGLPNANVTSLLVIGNTILAGLDGAGVYLSTDNGDNWVTENLGLWNMNITSLGANSSYLFAGTGVGVWRRPLNQMITGVAQTDRRSPESYGLFQNYPNPFNPSTTIRFDVIREGIVTMKVYNVIGQEVAVLVNGRYAPGNYTTAFNATNFPSGAYLYRLSVNGFSETKSMMVVK